MEVKFKKLHPDAVLPKHAKYGDAGLDLTITQINLSAFTKSSGVEIGLTELHHYGVSVEIPEKHVGLIFPRSSIKDYNVSLTNSVGVIDSGYRGELKAVFRVHKDPSGMSQYRVGDRSAQLVIIPYVMAETMFVDNLSDSERGDSGYGSTNKSADLPEKHMYLEEVQNLLASHEGCESWEDYICRNGIEYAEISLGEFANHWGITIVDSEE